MNLNVLILAGGLGTRMKSATPKVMHSICGKPILEYIVDTSQKLEPSRIILLTGNGSQSVKEYFKGRELIEFAHQKEQLGTGDAVKSAAEHFDDSGVVLVLSGDVPLISENTLRKLLKRHEEADADVTLLTMILENPAGYGRIIKKGNMVTDIVEHKDADNEQRKIKEVNAGLYAFDAAFLKKEIYNLKNDNAQKEYYLTDLINVASNDKGAVSINVDDAMEVSGINNRNQLSGLEQYMLNSIRMKFMADGVTMRSPETIYIESSVHIDNDVTIEQCVTLKGNTCIGSESYIGANAYIENADIKKGSIIEPGSIIRK